MEEKLCFFPKIFGNMNIWVQKLEKIHGVLCLTAQQSENRHTPLNKAAPVMFSTRHSLFI